MYTRKCYNGLACGSPRRASLLLAPVLTRRGRSRRAGLGDVSSTQNQIVSTANQYGVPPSIALAVAQIESSFNQAAVSSAGAIGVMQLMPKTAAGLNVDPTDATQNIQGGVDYLAQLYNQFGNWPAALAAYNAGPTGSVSGPPNVIAAGQTYASQVLSAQPNYLGFDAASTSFDSSSASDSSGVDLSSVSSFLPDLSDSSNMLPWLLVGLAAAGLIYAVS